MICECDDIGMPNAKWTFLSYFVEIFCADCSDLLKFIILEGKYKKIVLELRFGF